MADEIQTGLGRTGRMFACDHDNTHPDVYVLGKALGGGIFPISAVAASKEILGVFEPGSHGSTFGGNPLACAIARTALEVVKDEELVSRADRLGRHFRNHLAPYAGKGNIDLVRGRGLLNAVVMNPAAGPARAYCERLQDAGILAKETHQSVIRFAPPLTITETDLDWALEQIVTVLDVS
jgi:ornithine--oxo-acid transaminase